MNPDTILILIIVIGTIAIFLASIIGIMIYNPNYSFKELLKHPSKIFDIIKKAADITEEQLENIGLDDEEVKDKIEDVTRIDIDKLSKNVNKAENITEKIEDVVESIKDKTQN